MIFKVILIFAIAGAAVAFAIGILIGHFAIKKSSNTSTNNYKYDQLTKPADQQVYKTFIDSVQAANIEDNLKDLTSRPHMAGLQEDLDSAQVIEQRWIKDGLQVFKPKYNVLLSYPDDNNLNRVALKRSDGSTIFETSGVEKVYDPEQAKTVNPFLAYTPNGTVSSTRLYYANYGRLDDLQELADRVGRENLNGSIIMMRYGRLFRGDKIMHAQQFGAIGAILYNDPANYAPYGITPNQTYDQTWYMPPGGAQRGSTYTSNGDPLTPVYPSTEYIQRAEEKDISFLPKIVAQPIGYDEAQKLFQYMSGNEVGTGWSGSLPNTTYRFGGPLSNSLLAEVRSYNRRERKDVYNVIGIMKGDIEPDRYVLIGNHRDAWSLGALDPTSGTATLLEITRVLGDMYTKGFRPRRSLMFCSWGAEEYGLIGSIEYVEEYVKVLGARIVSYLNLDVAVFGSYTVEVSSSPMLVDTIIAAGKMVQSAYDPEGETVYDKWMKVHQNTETKEPKIEYGLGSGSDYLGFDQLIGSSNYDASYAFNPATTGNLSFYPLYHTSYEVFTMVKKFVDPEFRAHQTMGRLTGVLALILSESPILPLNVTRYSSALNLILGEYEKLSQVDLTSLRAAINDFNIASQQFVTRAKTLDFENPFEVRMYNDQLLQLERAFINPLGQGDDYTDLKHVIYAPSKSDKYAASGFPAIADALYSDSAAEVKKQVAIASFFVRGALATLKEFNQFIIA